jgi:hypothetical protein
MQNKPVFCHTNFFGSGRGAQWSYAMFDQTKLSLVMVKSILMPTCFKIKCEIHLTVLNSLVPSSQKNHMSELQLQISLSLYS